MNLHVRVKDLTTLRRRRLARPAGGRRPELHRDLHRRLYGMLPERPPRNHLDLFIHDVGEAQRRLLDRTCVEINQ